MDLPLPRLSHVATLQIDLGPVREMGRGRGGVRRIIPITGGTVEGPRLRGRVLDIGADWQTVYRDGLAYLDTRYAMETHDGAIIEIVNRGHRHGPAEVLDRVARGEPVPAQDYYMRTHARLETGDDRYAWVNRALFVGVGARHAAAVSLALHEIV